MNSNGNGKSLMMIIGKAMLFGSLQFSIGSVEMSSKFSVKNFAKDQETIDHAADALTDYIIVAMIWLIGTTLMFYSNYGMRGALASIFSNLFIIGWIVISYLHSFRYAASRNGLAMPALFRKREY